MGYLCRAVRGIFYRAIQGDMTYTQVHTLTASYTYIPQLHTTVTYKYIYIYIYIHITLHLHHIYIYIYIHIHTCIYICTRHCVSVCWRVCVCVCVCLSEDTQIVRPSIYLLTCLCVRLSVWTVFPLCLSVCLPVCLSVILSKPPFSICL